MKWHRPVYEGKDDMSREAVFSRLVAEKFNCTLVKMPKLSGVDFCISSDGELAGFLEVKVRTNRRQQYPTYMISAKKIAMAESLMSAFGLPTVLAVRWSDSWGHTDLNGLPQEYVSFGGRKDRNDPQDMEPVFLIPMSRFSVIPLPASGGRSHAEGAPASSHPDDQAVPASEPQESACWP